jgi:hypothetical protein
MLYEQAHSNECRMASLQSDKLVILRSTRYIILHILATQKRTTKISTAILGLNLRGL